MSSSVSNAAFDGTRVPKSRAGWCCVTAFLALTLAIACLALYSPSSTAEILNEAQSTPFVHSITIWQDGKDYKLYRQAQLDSAGHCGNYVAHDIVKRLGATSQPVESPQRCIGFSGNSSVLADIQTELSLRFDRKDAVTRTATFFVLSEHYKNPPFDILLGSVFCKEEILLLESISMMVPSKQSKADKKKEETRKAKHEEEKKRHQEKKPQNGTMRYNDVRLTMSNLIATKKA